MENPIEKFERKIESFYTQFVLNVGYFAAGEAQLRHLPNNNTAKVSFNKNESSDKILLSDLRAQSEAVKSSIAELFQIKAVAAFNDLLTDIFAYYISRRMSGQAVPGLGIQTAKIDFSLAGDIGSRIGESVIDNFAFQKYADRIATVRRILGPNDSTKNELAFIRKHVLIRNSTQHHDGVFYEKMSVDLGALTLSVRDSEGLDSSVNIGEQILISASEVLLLRSNFQRLVSIWKVQLS